MDIEGKTFTVVASVGYGGGIDWDEGGVLRDSNGKLFWLHESGCSCDGFGMYTDLEDLEPLASWQEAVQFARDLQYYDWDFSKKYTRWSDDEIASFAEELQREMTR